MGSKDNRTLKYCSSFEFSGLTGTIYGCADSKNVGLMNSWWKMSRMMKIVGILGIPRILLILSIYWLYYPPRQYRAVKEEEVPISRNPTHQWANLPVKPNYRSHRLWVSCPLGENETRLRQVTRRFCARILTHNLQTTNCLCLMSRTLSPDELILLLSVSGSVAQELSP